MVVISMTRNCTKCKNPIPDDEQLDPVLQKNTHAVTNVGQNGKNINYGNE